MTLGRALQHVVDHGRLARHKDWPRGHFFGFDVEEGCFYGRIENKPLMDGYEFDTESEVKFKGGRDD